ncbi:MAG: flagellin, partial [Halanaerobiales bacterium]|nr:flagellin [Halanaerobiales bacterium]
MRINTNIAALNSYNQLQNTNNSLQKSLQRLSSGKRINSAADDAAGLAISEKMKAQMNGLAQAQRNAQDGISMIQTAEGALKETHSMLQRMRELSVQASNDTNTVEDRVQIQKELHQLSSQIEDISDDTQFNTKALLNGNLTAGSGNAGVQTFQVGANKGETLTLEIKDMGANTGALGVNAGKVVNINTSGSAVFSGGAGSVDVTTQSGAAAAIKTIDDAIQDVSDERSKLGAVQNRLDHTINNLSATEENLTAAN